MSLSRTALEGEQLENNDCPLFTNPSLAFTPMGSNWGLMGELTRLLDTWILPVEAIFWANAPPPEALSQLVPQYFMESCWHFVYSAMTQNHSNMQS